jgi:hypothetical protein
MATWKQVTDYDGPTVQINMDNVTRMWRRAGDQITTVYFVSGGGNEVYVTVKESRRKYFWRNRYGRLEICSKKTNSFMVDRPGDALHGEQKSGTTYTDP